MEIFYYAQGERIQINKKLHIHSPLRKCDTLCSKNFSYVDVSTKEIDFRDGDFFSNGFKIENESMCKKCVDVFVKTQNLTQ